ncbi:MAG: hypothetical protein EPN62_00155 [Candidimonas sp.]|nr:MAG: hypothetical protein EPN62_00155 [Candidimonas sp.]
MTTDTTTATAWTLLSNGNVQHRSGVVLCNDGQRWKMTEVSGLDFVLTSLRVKGLSVDEAKSLADALILEGVRWIMALH